MEKPRLVSTGTFSTIQTAIIWRAYYISGTLYTYEKIKSKLVIFRLNCVVHKSKNYSLKD